MSDQNICNAVNDDELQWTSIRRLPLFQQMKTSLFDRGEESGEVRGKRVVDVAELSATERRQLIEKLTKHADDDGDHLRLLKKLRERMDRVNVRSPSIEARYENLCVEAECDVVDGKPLPTLWNTARSMISGLLKLPGMKPREATIKILQNASGIIKPSRMTLIIGSPGCGKTTLLRALAGKLDKSLKTTGVISYNGYMLEEFVPEKTSAYISQYDLHIPEMTVRETLDFSARFQGVGSRAEMLKEIIRREQQEGIIPESDVDTYMKAISLEGLEKSLQTDYILKVMGLEDCGDTMIGDTMRQGISGGQKKRLTAGEMIVGPAKALFIDEISTGLDSSTAFQMVTFLQRLAHNSEATIAVSLLQLEPETYNLFDDIILMAEGTVVYHGPRSAILDFFEECGFRCPERKAAADFLLEVLSLKDQKQYWYRQNKRYSYVSVDDFSKKFKTHHIGLSLEEELSQPCDKTQYHSNALSFKAYSLPKWELFKACMAREFLLIKRNSFIYIFKTIQLSIVAFITMTVWLRTQMGIDVVHANYYLGALFYSIIVVTVNGFPEMTMTVARLPVFYKQRDLYFYPAWAYAISACILKIPVSLVESLIWTSLTYYVIGYSPEVARFLCQFLLNFLLHQMAMSFFRFIGSYFQNMVSSMVSGNLALLVMWIFGGFILPRHSIPDWLKWGFWASPITYAEIGLTVNEFLAPRWQKISSTNATIGQEVLQISSTNATIGQEVLASHGLDFNGYFFWTTVGVMLGYIVLFNVAFTLALTYKRAPGMSRAIISRENISQIDKQDLGNATYRTNDSKSSSQTIATAPKRTGRTALPFVPLAITFQNVQYYVDTPPEMRRNGYEYKRSRLLHDITGVFRPGILSAVMGVSGAGKTTLMDVLAGRKTSGTIEGDIRIGGYPKVQETFTRISGYCEQTDIHSPQITVEESVKFSAWLRLPPEIDSTTRYEFVNEVLDIIELDDIRDALVGMPGVSGLSIEQRKRLTIAVELVSNPSVIFMDEPTSGLDARAAAIVMRTVKNVAETGRTVVCTIHQPSIDMFEAFDELILMKTGGEVIYSGQIGQHSSRIIEHFEGIPTVPRIKDNYNPATWMMEVTSISTEMQLGIDFAQLYKQSSLYTDTEDLVKQLSNAPTGSMDLSFPRSYPQNHWEQLELACGNRTCPTGEVLRLY